MEHTIKIELVVKEQVKLEPPDEQELPPKLTFGPPLCIICERPAPIESMLILTLDEAAELLAAACSYGKRIEQTKRIVCQKPLMRCKRHEALCYEMMCKATGATCEYDIEKASIENILKLYEFYKQIKDARNAMDNKPPIIHVRLGRFIRMIRSFFHDYAPIQAYINLREKFNDEQIKKLSSPNATLGDLLSTKLEPDEQHHLLMSMQNEKSRSTPEILDEFIKKRKMGSENFEWLAEHEKEPKRARYSKYFSPGPKVEQAVVAPSAPVAPPTTFQVVPNFNILTYRPRPRAPRRKKGDRPKPVVICPITGGFVRVPWDQEEQLAEHFELSTEPLRAPDHLLEEQKPELLLKEPKVEEM